MLARIKVKENPVAQRNLCVRFVIVALCCAYCATCIRAYRNATSASGSILAAA
jgi:hypothetical protein